MTGHRLLWAYPWAYRRAHTDEIVTTLPYALLALFALAAARPRYRSEP